MRFDLALFELRLFKSRSQASAAIQSGSALLNGKRAKPSHILRPGDHVTLAGPRGARTLEVLELPARPLSREQARALVRETFEGPGGE